MSSQNRTHKRKAVVPSMVVGSATPSQISSRTADNRRQRNTVGVVNQDAGPSTGPMPVSWAAEDLETNRARMDDAFTYSLGDASLSAQNDDMGMPDDGDRPLKTWYASHVDEYVEEQLRREGRGSPKVRCDQVAEWRCADQACFGEIMHCAECLVAAHAQLPTHFVEKWNGTHWVRKRSWLRDLGLRVQLGHRPGTICTYRQAAPQDFVLFDVSGVHEIAVDYCGCRPRGGGEAVEHRIQLLRACWWPATVKEPTTCATIAVLQLFQIINCLGKLSVYDFLRGLELCTNHDGLDKPLDRRKPFMHIVRQYRETKRMKRAKRGHLAGGVKATAQGELVVDCRACPHLGKNMPEDWKEIEAVYRFIYFLFLAQDANFRLSNRNVSSEAADPILGDGFGYFCKREGDDGYKAHIAKHVNEAEASSCSGFQAMFMANTRNVKGLRTTGIGGVTCSRHNMWRANGIGDLQVGERFCNMDFLLLSALLTFGLLYLVVSYDIACQYALNFWERMGRMPERMRLKLAPSNVWWKVPNFHLPPHKKPCHSPYSFHWMWGAGMTHGEGVEQNWAFSNGAAASTRLMGPGSRQATLEDIFGFHNYDRVLAMYRVLPKRLAVSIKEGTKHKAVFDAFSAGLEEVAEWRQWVTRWESKQHTGPAESPFELTEQVTTLRDIQLQIAEEELICTDDGVEIEQEHTAGAFIAMGLDIEEQQRRLEVDVKALKDPSPTQRLAFTKRRTALLKRIFKFRQIQRVYMPAVRAILSDTQRQMFDGNGEQLPKATQLFLPSEIENATLRGRACAAGLAETEARMREGETVREGLRTRTMTNRYKLRNFTGQGMMTKGQGILRQINIKIHIAKLRYRYLRAALVATRGHGAWEDKLQGGVARAEGLAQGEGQHTLSWIWYTVPAGARSDEKLNDALRVEWCKAYARAKHYSEDVCLLREEMRRTIAFGYAEAAEWDALASAVPTDGVTDELAEGRCAYAAERADTERRTCAMLQRKWAGIRERADTYLAGQSVADEELVVVELDLGDELDPEEEEARLEGGEED
ncbi:hypothetical protein C8F04DRAFT_1211814 [Mycena alexandri]|uniref:CxC2-like cysteine cluster KDZ transposase-associated domain-containing protein n=1 Tax=Mycena alexandri TaxID=1745969 RepID=A0AAD6SPA7_9AGAR|nr:hypothetical protein C8F04DRAFT_1211814 [Mycena alexandri]